MLTLKQDLPFDVSTDFCEFVTTHIKRDGLSVINLRDSSYHPDTGGFRPVEIMVDKVGEHFAIIYYTEFRYFGSSTYAELGKSNDFDFSHGIYFSDIMGERPIDSTLSEAFNLFVKNTLNYIKLEVLDEVECSFVGGHLMLHKDA